MSSYRISFTRPVEGRYTLQAVAEDRKTRQSVGFTKIVGDEIWVTTVSGKYVATVATRKQAAQVIDAWHREHNLDAYSIWAGDTLAV